MFVAVAETERKRFRDKLLSAEQELAAAKRREQDLQEQLMKGVNSSEERLRRQLQLFNELEVLPIQLQFMHAYFSFVHVVGLLVPDVNLWSPATPSILVEGVQSALRFISFTNFFSIA